VAFSKKKMHSDLKDWQRWKLKYFFSICRQDIVMGSSNVSCLVFPHQYLKGSSSQGKQFSPCTS